MEKKKHIIIKQNKKMDSENERHTYNLPVMLHSWARASFREGRV